VLEISGPERGVNPGFVIQRQILPLMPMRNL